MKNYKLVWMDGIVEVIYARHLSHEKFLSLSSTPFDGFAGMFTCFNSLFFSSRSRQFPKKLHNAISVYLRVNRIVYTHSYTRKVQTAHSCERNERRKSLECNVMEHVIVSQTPFHLFFALLRCCRRLITSASRTHIHNSHSRLNCLLSFGSPALPFHISSLAGVVCRGVTGM